MVEREREAKNEGEDSGVSGSGRPDPKEGGGGLDPVHEETGWGRKQRKGSYSWSTRREPGGWAPAAPSPTVRKRGGWGQVRGERTQIFSNQRSCLGRPDSMMRGRGRKIQAGERETLDCGTESIPRTRQNRDPSKRLWCVDRRGNRSDPIPEPIEGVKQNAERDLFRSHRLTNPPQPQVLPPPAPKAMATAPSPRTHPPFWSDGPRVVPLLPLVPKYGPSLSFGGDVGRTAQTYPSRSGAPHPDPTFDPSGSLSASPSLSLPAGRCVEECANLFPLLATNPSAFASSKKRKKVRWGHATAMATSTSFLALFLLCGTGLQQAFAGDSPDTFFLAPNGVTVRCPEAAVGETGVVDGITYTKRDRTGLDALTTDLNDPQIARSCTTGITDMGLLFQGPNDFNQDISTWDTSTVTTMSFMFNAATKFNSDISKWDTSQVNSMEAMFLFAEVFAQNLSSWDVTEVTNCRSTSTEDTIYCNNVWRQRVTTALTDSTPTCAGRLDSTWRNPAFNTFRSHHFPYDRTSLLTSMDVGYDMTQGEPGPPRCH
eukprot:scaffold849_cov386-Pavlova_lutheri.AAC.3